MICKHCGCQIDTSKRKSDGSIQCPKCKVVYRPRPKAKPQAKKNKSFVEWLKSIPWKKKIWKFPLWLWVVALVLIVGSIGNMTDKKEDTQSNSINTMQDQFQYEEPSFENDSVIEFTEQQTETVQAEQSEPEEVIEDPFEYSALQVFKEDYTVSNQDGGNIYVRFLIDGINAEWTIKAFKNSATNYCKQLSMNFPDAAYTSIHFTGYCAAVDQYGNSLYQDAIRLTIDKSEIDKINWERFVFGNIDSIGYDYVLGSLLR